MDETNCTVVGQSVHRIDSRDKLTGTARYAGDIIFPDMLHVKVLRSDRPHARILAVRTAAALACPGVVAVLTHDDIPGKNLFGRDRQDQTVLCVDKVRYVGDPIAVVAAETEAAAEAARTRIEVDYQDLPGVFSPEAALRPGAEPLHPDGNLLMAQGLRRGDPEAACQGAAIVIRNTYHTQMVEHAYLEPEAGVAIPEGQGLTVWMPSKYAHFDQRELSGVLGLPPERLRIVNTTIGGCFGDKTSLSAGYYAALAARVTGRPARMVYTRQESFLATRKRHPFTIDYTTAADGNGTLLAVLVDVLIDAGAYCSSSPTVVVKALIHAAGPYEVPHVSAKVRIAYTNNPVGGSMRGLGVPQMAFAHESQMDLLARRLSLDPAELRLRNAMRSGSVTATGQRLGASVGLTETLTRVRQEMERLGTPTATATKRYGWGLASMFYGIAAGGRPNPARARVAVDEDGTFTLSVGIGDVGQGSSTVLAQIAAEVLRQPVTAIRLITGDTACCPDSGITAASRVTYLVGRAVQMAAETLLERLRQAAAARFGTAPESLRYGPGGFFLPGTPQARLSVAETVPLLRTTGQSPVAEAFHDHAFTPIDPDTGQGEPMETYAFATHGALVGVDCESGEVEVLKIIACHDVGRAVNPAAVEGQIEGAVSMGMGFGLLEEIVLAQGRMQNAGFGQYYLSTALDMPQMVSLIAEAPEARGPFGAKGVGEPALIPTAPAIVNAIHTATGVRVRTLPVTPERLWRLLPAAGEKGEVER